MPHTTMGYDVFHAGSPKLFDSLRAGNTLAHKLLSVHMLQGYADNRANAGQGCIWKISLPVLTWNRGLAQGTIAASPNNPGISYDIDDSFLIRNFNQIHVERIW